MLNNAPKENAMPLKEIQQKGFKNLISNNKLTKEGQGLIFDCLSPYLTLADFSSLARTQTGVVKLSPELSALLAKNKGAAFTQFAQAAVSDVVAVLNGMPKKLVKAYLGKQAARVADFSNKSADQLEVNFKKVIAKHNAQGRSQMTWGNFEVAKRHTLGRSC